MLIPVWDDTGLATAAVDHVLKWLSGGGLEFCRAAAPAVAGIEIANPSPELGPARLNLETRGWRAEFRVPVHAGAPREETSAAWATLREPGGGERAVVTFSPTPEGARARLHVPLLGLVFRRLAGLKTPDAAHDDPSLPIADLLAVIMRETGRRLSSNAGEAARLPLTASANGPTYVCLTHDVDVIRKDAAVRFKKGGIASRLAAGALLAGRPAAAGRHLAAAWRLLAAPADYRAAAARLIAREREAGRRSTWFFSAARAAGHGPWWRRALLEPAYAPNEPALRELAAAVTRERGEIGLHGGITAARSAAALIRERQLLEAGLGVTIRSQRFHWLAFAARVSPAVLDEAGIAQDSTVGHVRGGFAAGTTRPFPLWLQAETRPSACREIPLVFQDMAALLSATPPTPQELLARIVAHLEWIKRLGGVAAINWHPETLAPDFGWGEAYRGLLEWLREESLAAGPMCEAPL